MDGKAYAVPYYAGSKYIFYRKDLFEAAGIEVPTTMDEFVQAAIDLKAANPDPANFSGFWFPGQDWRNGVAFLWDAGGDLAVQDGDEWQGALSAPESVQGLETVQTLMEQASGAAKDGNEENPQTPVLQRRGRHALRARLGEGAHRGPRLRLPRHGRQPRRLRAPGHRRPARTGAARRLRHRDLGQVQEPGPRRGRRRPDAQRRLPEADGGGRAHAGQELAGRASSAATSSPQATIAAASNAKLTPAAPGWAEVEGSRVLEDLFVDIAKGGDVEELAAAADEKITEQLN